MMLWPIEGSKNICDVTKSDCVKRVVLPPLCSSVSFLLIFFLYQDLHAFFVAIAFGVITWIAVHAVLSFRSYNRELTRLVHHGKVKPQESDEMNRD